MSGIYIHIPFCKQACHYCNFHFSTTLKLKGDIVSAICKEIMIQKNYLKEKSLTSIYFGGGTPSLLTDDELGQIFNALHEVYTWTDQTEITLEANPDDIHLEKLMSFKKWGINRLSIGIQSFFNEDLQWMNRAHNAQEAQTCIKMAQDVGFDNITIDLIYGSPTTTFDMWQENIKTALSLDIPHISSYCLTVEEGTALHHHVKKGKKSSPDTDMASRQFTTLIEKLTAAGYQHYEISNFAKPGKYAIHNTNYWKGAQYLGIGPSAHSFDGGSRSWNIAHNQKYIQSLNEGIIPSETEVLSTATRYNEYIMTGLRTMWGVNLEEINRFGAAFGSYFLDGIQSEIQAGFVTQEGNKYTLTQVGKHFADGIASNLFWVE
jgi:oxygen-independent coproporphyrinogen III oxidase